MKTVDRQQAETKSTINPATGKTIAEHTLLTEDQAVKAVESIHEAFLQWRDKPVEKRAEIIQNLADQIRKRKDDIAELMSLEMGKTLKEGYQEIELCAGICEYTAKNGPAQLKDEERELEGGRALVSYRPIGIVFGIQPWNFPLYQAVRYTIPNLVAGNAVILKHAQNVWGSGDLLEEMMMDAGIPQNVFRHLKINHDTAEVLMKHELVRGVTFTGSPGAGAKIASIAAEALKKTVLELGSNDAYLVLSDADIELAVETSVMGRVNNCGQTCVAAKRFIVVEKNYEAFRDAYVKAMKEIRPGDPLDGEPDIGPMARKDLRETLHEQVRKSVEKGARCLAGGTIPKGDGFYYPATVLDNVEKGMPAYDDELFGPVASLIKARDDEHAMEIANDSRFGLGGGIFSSDIERAVELAKTKFDTGMVNINGYHLAQPNLPFGGVKDSGYGREHGGFGIREFVNVKSIMIAECPRVASPLSQDEAGPLSRDIPWGFSVANSRRPCTYQRSFERSANLALC
jgi:succinate-semialdehyde dehydrogenase/glutarate-semialdehyde dehydrogenase